MLPTMWRAFAVVNLADPVFLRTGRADAVLGRHWLWLLVLILCLTLTAAEAVRLHRKLRRSRSELAEACQRRHGTEASLRQCEARYCGLFEHLSLGNFQATLDGRLIQVNSALAALAGYASPREMLASVDGVDWPFCIPPDQRAEVLSRVAPAEEAVSYETQFRRGTGEEVAARVTLRMVREGRDSGSYLEGYAEDITQARHARDFAAAQRDLGIQLAAVSNTEQALRLFMETAIRVTGMDSGEIYLLDRDTRAVVLVTGSWYCPACPHRI